MAPPSAVKLLLCALSIVFSRSPHTYLHVVMVVVVVMMPHHQRMVPQVDVRVLVRHRVRRRMHTCCVQMVRRTATGWRLARQEVLHFPLVSVGEKENAKGHKINCFIET